MGNTSYIVLGNGFSIDLINHIKDANVKNKINLKNLFEMGDEVIWPKSTEKGFLSRKHCPHLWTLGARPTLSDLETSEVITEIITCMNVYNLVKSKESDIALKEQENIYIQAYNELCTYLKNLFVFYNEQIQDDKDLKPIIEEIELVSYIKNELCKENEVIIVTYNYDIFLERLLKIAKIPFLIEGINKKSKINKVRIIKPHGSISFSIPTTMHTYNIKNISDSIQKDMKEIIIDNNPKDENSSLCAIIPPAGDSERVISGWSKTLRDRLDKYIKKSTEKDTLMIYGLSYDHVDRMEMDNIITQINSNVKVIYINPYPSKTLDAVLSSVFENYYQIKSL